MDINRGIMRLYYALILICLLFLVTTCSLPSDEDENEGNNPKEQYTISEWSPLDTIISYHFEFDTLGRSIPDSSGYRLLDSSGNTIRDFKTILNKPRWSNDGKWLITSINNNIYKISLDEKQIIQLTNDPMKKNYPSWSSNDSLIAFVNNQGSFENQGIWIINSNGGQSRLLFNYNVDKPGISEFSWSPNGNEIAFFGYVDGIGYKEICILDTLTASIVKLYKSDRRPDWLRFSPNGQQLLFGKNAEGYLYDIWIINRDGSGLKQIIKNGKLACWNPDGTKILYSKYNWQKNIRDWGMLFLYDLETGRQIQFTDYERR